LPAGGMWRAAPVKAAKISRGEFSQYRSKAALNGGGRPLAMACAIRLAYSSVGEDFGWARLIGASANQVTLAGIRVAAIVKIGEIHTTNPRSGFAIVGGIEIISYRAANGAPEA